MLRVCSEYADGPAGELGTHGAGKGDWHPDRGVGRAEGSCQCSGDPGMHLCL